MMGDISKDFNRYEFSCQCGCGFNTVDVELIIVVQDVRDYFGQPVRINSGCRCPKHNAAIGGSKNSQHLFGKAADIVVLGVFAWDVDEYLKDKYPDKYGIGRYSGWTHIDVRAGKARWKG